jgi:hypothetical protein
MKRQKSGLKRTGNFWKWIFKEKTMTEKPALHSHTITNKFLLFIGVRECFAFAKPHKQTLQPKLGKECVCPSAPSKRPTKQRTKKNIEAITACIWQ